MDCIWGEDDLFNLWLSPLSGFVKEDQRIFGHRHKQVYINYFINLKTN